MGEDVFYYETEIIQRSFSSQGAEPRAGTMRCPDTDADDIMVQTPVEFKGPNTANGKDVYITPEHMYVGSAAVCVFTTCVTMAENSNLNYKDIVVKGKGKMENLPDGSGRWISEIDIHLTFKIFNEKDMKKASRVAEKVEGDCLIAKSMKTKINFTYEIFMA
jgi:uncharacterized OsmC-like protein